MSSDEEDGEELNRSLEGFVVNNTHYSQGLNGTALVVASTNVTLKKFRCSHFGDVSVLVDRLGDALCLPEVGEKPCSPGQVQNVLQKPSQHGHIFPGKPFVNSFSSSL